MYHLNQIIQMVENTKWTDKFLELQIWTRLTSMAFESHNHHLVMLCSKKALRFSAMGTQPRNRKMNLYAFDEILNIYSLKWCVHLWTLLSLAKMKMFYCRAKMPATLSVVSRAVSDVTSLSSPWLPSLSFQEPQLLLLLSLDYCGV